MTPHRSEPQAMTDEESSRRLRQLLRLKRHESPPPGYFRDFSGGVIDRIRVMEAERSTPMWRRGRFRWSSSVPDGFEPRSGGWPLLAGVSAGALALVALVGGFQWGGGSLGPEGSARNLAGGEATRASAQGPDRDPLQEIRGPSVGLAGMDSLDGRWNVGFRWPVSVSIAADAAPGTVAMSAPIPAPIPASDGPQMSSTNPWPSGLFRLPGAARGPGPEAYRVRFGDTPR